MPAAQDQGETRNDVGRLLHVFAAKDFIVVAGANLKDCLGLPDELCPGDAYELDSRARPQKLHLLQAQPGGHYSLGPDTGAGQPGDRIRLLSRLIFMSPDGQKAEALLLRERGPHRPDRLWLLPLTPLAPQCGYILLSITEPGQALRLADLLSLSFHRGTRILLADGRAVAVEDLTPGTRILTRDHGPQPVAAIGRTLQPARGLSAPVVIAKGAMGNSDELVLGPNHRLFIYLRRRLAGQQQSELLIQARHLVDNESITFREGGFAEYFSLIFERHEIIYAEGIPVESLMVNDATLPALPEDLRQRLAQEFPGLSQRQHIGQEAGGEVSLNALRLAR